MIKPGLYRHYRGGKYVVIGVAQGADFLKADTVVYIGLAQKRLFYRNISKFKSPVMGDEPRYMLLRELSPVEVSVYLSKVIAQEEMPDEAEAGEVPEPDRSTGGDSEEPLYDEEEDQDLEVHRSTE